MRQAFSYFEILTRFGKLIYVYIASITILKNDYIHFRSAKSMPDHLTYLFYFAVFVNFAAAETDASQRDSGPWDNHAFTEMPNARSMIYFITITDELGAAVSTPYESLP